MGPHDNTSLLKVRCCGSMFYVHEDEVLVLHGPLSQKKATQRDKHGGISASRSGNENTAKPIKTEPVCNRIMS